MILEMHFSCFALYQACRSSQRNHNGPSTQISRGRQPYSFQVIYRESQSR